MLLRSVDSRSRRIWRSFHFKSIQSFRFNADSIDMYFYCISSVCALFPNILNMYECCYRQGSRLDFSEGGGACK